MKKSKSTNAYRERICRTCDSMESGQVGCLLLTPSSNMRYLCGYGVNGDERLMALVIAPGREPFIFANVLYKLQVQETFVTEAVYWEDGENAYDLLADEINRRGISTKVMALDDHMRTGFSVPIARSFPGTKLILAGQLLDDMRVYKDELEMELMSRACELADCALERVICRGVEWIGKTESEFKAALVYEMLCLGLKIGDPVVAVGESGAAPHHVAGARTIESGMGLLVDFSARFQGYCSDMTRTFHFGEPNEEFRRVYDIVLEANYCGQEAAKAGNRLQDVDRTVRNYIASKGYGEFFIHRTGHGIGIDIHEGPAVCEGETCEIRPGMAFSIEPGIYLPGRFGVRIEDQVLICDTGTRILHKFPRELQIIRS